MRASARTITAINDTLNFGGVIGGFYCIGLSYLSNSWFVGLSGWAGWLFGSILLNGISAWLRVRKDRYMTA